MEVNLPASGCDVRNQFEKEITMQKLPNSLEAGAEMLEAHRQWLKNPAHGRRADMEGLDLTSVNGFMGENLSSANLRQCRMYNSTFEETDFSYAELSYAWIRSSYLNRINLHDAYLRFSILSSVHLMDADLSEARMPGAYLTSCNFHRSNISKASLMYCTVESCFFPNSKLSGTDFRYSSLFACKLEQADLSNAHLNHGRWSDVDLRNANLRGANLTDTDFKRVDFRGADLSNANLSNARFIDCNLSDVNLNNANLDQATFSRTLLDGSPIHGVASMNETLGNGTQIKHIVCDSYTVTYTAEHLFINGHKRSEQEWWSLDDDQASTLVDPAWWKTWKPILQQITAVSPAVPAAITSP
ncbi:pentapeptide repeat-containing protein [Pseudomonas sp. BN411]|uniref:pentapeptide repeat-containing protein n=1 Tax=Pseudomonas sp. BN411 TaxID=2567887 RepID=UPI0024584EC2|nr:pentapeptide repeat-containing protein [Pseudomonas sp. BN411]MDH4563644.1 pentapeptide repeat-containing protein [Pseudomonas sp. BN411]